MPANKGTVFLMVFCAVLAIVGLTYVGRGDDATVRAEVSSVPAAIQAAPSAPEKAPEAPPQDVETAQKPDPKLVVPPVDEPEMPLDAKEGRKYEYVPLHNSGGFVFERPAPDGKKISGVVVPGTILVTRGVVELFGCGEGGKEHETILRLECDVQSLDMAFTLAGFKRGKLPKKLDLEEPDQGTRIVALVQWTSKEGKVVTYRSEDLIVSVRRRGPMPRVGWTYVAQWAEVVDPTNPRGDRKNKVLAAAGTRSFVTTFRDSSALLDNPLEEAFDDTLFSANYMLLPDPGTPVRVIFRGLLESERKEILALEKDLAKEPKFVAPKHDHEHDEKDPAKKDEKK